MAEYFLDTSAFRKYYVDEARSGTVRDLLTSASEDEDGYGVYVAAVTLVKPSRAYTGVIGRVTSPTEP